MIGYLNNFIELDILKRSLDIVLEKYLRKLHHNPFH